jgi:hypothetical protein
MMQDASGQFDDRRSVPRFEHMSAAELVRLDARGEPTADWWQIHLRDLSVRGVQLLAAQPLEVGTRVVIALRPHVADPTLRLAIVRRVIERRERWTTLGVAFQPFTEIAPRPWKAWTSAATQVQKCDVA